MINKILRKIRGLCRILFTYICVIGSFLLGRCSFAKLRAFLHEYTSFQYRRFYRRITGKSINITHYNGKKILSCEEGNKIIADAIERGEPFMAGRYGSVEIDAVWRVRDDSKSFIAPIEESLQRLTNNAGFFPKDKQIIIKFAELMKWATSQVNLMTVWFNPMEEYMLRTYGNNPEYCGFTSLEPYFSSCPWSAKLEGKKVLVIHPFYKSIPYQYSRRELLFPGKNVLPKFELIMQRAVQTMLDCRDPRFNNWFEALDYMYNEAMSKDFDVAIIGCGAYGFPLAAKLKAAGKIAIHMGGATQIMFGIKGRRWEESDSFTKMFNENWIRPSVEETPEGHQKAEDSCYW